MLGILQYYARFVQRKETRSESGWTEDRLPLPSVVMEDFTVKLVFAGLEGRALAVV